jgi:hypothetical protein
MIRSSFWKFSLLVCCLGACSASAQGVPAKPKTTDERITALEKQLEFANDWLRIISPLTGDRTAFIDCDSGKFSAVMPTSNTLVFLVSCSSITPYLEGYKISLNVGNPFAMQFSGVSGRLGYGDTPSAAYSESTGFSTTEPLQPGVWNSITVTINQVAAKNVRHIRIYDLAFTTAKGRSQ